jgi:hypothetical protein
MKAFPSKEYVQTSDEGIMAEVHYGGMDLRDYFAAKAMQGICANSEANREWTEKDVAEFSYRQADAMMKARENNG